MLLALARPAVSVAFLQSQASVLFFCFFSPDGSKHSSPAPTSRDGHQVSEPSPSVASPAAGNQPAPARPRPDHLPLGSPDPTAHPLYIGVASLTGGFVAGTVTVMQLNIDSEAKCTDFHFFQYLMSNSLI